MPIDVVCGINWGDEGKGRVIDYLAGQADAVVRFQGGNNAGHTVVNERGTFKLNLLPSGVLRPGIRNVLGPGMVIDLEHLAGELSALEERGVDCSGVVVADRATICFPFHALEDQWEEARLGKAAFGSTRRGIAPCYGDRFMKRGIQVGELLFPDQLRGRLDRLVALKAALARGVYGVEPGFTAESMFDWCQRFGGVIRSRIADPRPLLESMLASGRRVLLEAQLGALRDVQFGIYPFTSSSSSLASFGPIGSGLTAHHPGRVIGVMKAFSTCVGAGPFVTELSGLFADRLRETAGEYGTATGRPRRIGWFDAVASRYGSALQGATEIVLTKLDCLSGLAEIPVCTHYEIERSAGAEARSGPGQGHRAERTDAFPLTPLLDRAKPVYRTLPGWDADLTAIRRFADLPDTARRYVKELESLVGCRISMVSVGPERSQIITEVA